MPDRKFIDTSVLVYAFDRSEPAKHAVASRLLGETSERVGSRVISVQVLLELYNVLTRFISNPLPQNEAATIVDKLYEAASWEKLDYNAIVTRRAIVTAAERRTKIWDTLIAETMKENGVFTIITENEKDFGRIPGIRALNPFKSDMRE